MRRSLIKPVAFLDHFKGSECLLRLVVVIELPRQIADEKQEKGYACHNPNAAVVIEQACRHVERSRDISHSKCPEIPRLSYAWNDNEDEQCSLGSIAPENCARWRAIAAGDF